MKHLFAIIIALVFTGCATTDIVQVDLPDIKVEGIHDRQNGINHFSLPPGRYFASFQTKKGVYYQSTRKVIFKAVGINKPVQGGLFVPHADNEDQQQGVWIDNESAAAGLLGLAVTSVARVFKFKEPVKFKVLSESSAAGEDPEK